MKKEKVIRVKVQEDYPLVKPRHSDNLITNFSMIHRRYPDVKWDYKAIVLHLEGSDVIYYTLNDKGEETKGVEIYFGRNYVVGSDKSSYSRRYDVNDVPIKYKRYIRHLKSIHSKTQWSKRSYVDVSSDLM